MTFHHSHCKLAKMCKDEQKSLDVIDSCSSFLLPSLLERARFRETCSFAPGSFAFCVLVFLSFPVFPFCFLNLVLYYMFMTLMLYTSEGLEMETTTFLGTIVVWARCCPL